MKSFVDATTIQVSGGHGGNGCVSFASTRSAPKQGADGGHGGKGGDVWLVGTARLNTLRDLSRGKIYKGESGKNGQAQKKKGATGKDLLLEVPLGTEVFSGEQKLGVLNEPGERLCVALGGCNGLGNSAFLSSTQQRPRIASSGKPGEKRTLTLQLKVLADIGLAGYPNAGKSTLLRCLSAAKPTIGAYPFTTLSPQLGVMVEEDHLDSTTPPLIIADIPGLAPGAHKGKGLGHAFLRHLERTTGLALVVAAQLPQSFEKELEGLLYELSAYKLSLYPGHKNPYPLREKNKFLVITKTDLLSKEELSSLRQHLKKNSPYPWTLVSAHHHQGLTELKKQLRTLTEKLPQKSSTSQEEKPAEGESFEQEEMINALLAPLLSTESHVKIRPLSEETTHYL